MPNLIPTSIATPMLADKAKYATRMEDQGSGADAIFNTTGVVRDGGNGYFDYINKDALELATAVSAGDRMNRGLSVQVGDLGLNDMYDASPSIRSVPISINPSYANTNKLGRYEKYYDDISLADSPASSTRAATLMHEIQHALDQRGANNPKLDLLATPIRNMEEYIKDPGERRAVAAEITQLMSRYDNDKGRERLFNVVKRGLPSTSGQVEDAIINENVIKQMLRRRSK